MTMATTSTRPPPSRATLEKSRRPIEVIEEAERQWIYTEDELLRAPSIVDGLSADEERTFRYKGYNFITQVGIMLKLPQTTLASATVFFNRFLMRYSLKSRGGEKKLHHYVRLFTPEFYVQGERVHNDSEETDEDVIQQVAATALFLATKVEEHCRKVRELVIACCRVAQKNPNLIVDENTKDYWRWRDTILYNEDVLLELLCFDLTIESPYNVLFTLLQYYGVEKQKRLRDAAWSFINDSHMTQACLLFTSRTVACASVWFAAKQTGTQFEDDAQGRPWWEAQKVSTKTLRKALAYMGEFYTNTPTGMQVKGGGSGGESVYAALKSSPLDGREVEDDATRLRKSVTPMLMTPVRGERSGSEISVAGKRAREEDEEAGKVNGNGNGVPAVPVANGISRIPAAGREQANGDHPSKRQRTAETEGAPGGVEAGTSQRTAPVVVDEDAGSEEGEVEE
jgi:protein BUR2